MILTEVANRGSTEVGQPKLKISCKVWLDLNYQPQLNRGSQPKLNFFFSKHVYRSWSTAAQPQSGGFSSTEVGNRSLTQWLSFDLTEVVN
jgi:hypothetical protein